MTIVSSLWLVVLVLVDSAAGLGSMSSIAVSYGENGPVFCGLKTDGSHLATCYGSNSAITQATPPRMPFLGLTGGDGFVCGLLKDTAQPYCWGGTAYIRMGVPRPMPPGAEYAEIAAGDYHLCGLRRGVSVVDCWGYNMTRTFGFDAQIHSLSAGSEFTCAIFAQNRTAFCWGDDSSSRVASLAPRSLRFQAISAGGYHVCGLLEGPDSRAVCWGRSLVEEDSSLVSVSASAAALSSSVDAPPSDPLLSVAGGKFHACGIRSSDRGVVCWGLVVKPSTAVPAALKAYEIAAGNYFTCGMVAERSLLPRCWGSGFPTSLPLAVCMPGPCSPGSYELTPRHGDGSCRTCVPCTPACPPETYLKADCSAASDRLCAYNCSACASRHCSIVCSDRRFWSMQLPVIVAEIAFAIFIVVVVSAAALFYVRCRLRDCRCADAAPPKTVKKPEGAGERKVRRRARMFAYSELERATGGFNDDSLVGKGSFSSVFRGVLEDGTVVAVKRAAVVQKSWKEFHTELDLLSRLNHAHLLNLLGYCEDGDERLLVYEYMANGSLHHHLHGPGNSTDLDWVRRVTIAVQAARGIEYLHGYACPPVIHRDIKSSNILIDEEHNARVADFGLSLLGPADSCSPLPELPAGTLGYLDPEYYRLHYLTTKSDVYSFGVLLLEILSGRKAIHMHSAAAVNIVEWAVPLIKAGDLGAVLDPTPKAPEGEGAEEALRRIANVACKCVRMRGKERPSMDKVTTALERALALLMGTPCDHQPILPTEVVLGSTRLHKKPSQRSSSDAADDHNFRAPSWITFPSVASSQRRKSSVSEHDKTNTNANANTNANTIPNNDQEICPASPHHNLFLQHNF